MGAGGDIPSPAPTPRPAGARLSNTWKSPPTPATMFSPTSAADQKVVSLFDWWLFEAEKHVDGKRLAVSGFTKRQQAARIFYSAPIVKRNDAYTIEAADGVIVLLDGMINKSRTQDNGFPLEMCNHFLVGFPYDWDHYIGGYYRTRATCNPVKLSSHNQIPVDSTYSAGKTLPVHLEEFSFGRVRNFLSSAGNKVTDSFIALQKIVSSRMDPEMQKFVSSPVDELSKHVDKNDGTMVGSDPSFKMYAKGTATCHKQVAFSSLNENNAFPLTMSTRATSGMQKKPSVINLHEMKTDNHLVPILNLEENIRTQDSVYLNEDPEGHTNSTGNANILSNPSSKSLEISNLSHSEKIPDSVAEILPCSSKSALETISSSDCLFSPMDLKDENVTSMKGIHFASLKNSVHSEIVESKKAKAYQEDNENDGIMVGSVPSFKTFAEGTTNCHKQVAFSSLNENNAFPLTMSTQDTSDMQNKPSVINLHEMKIDNHLVPILNLEENIHTKDSVYLNEDAEGYNNSGNVNILSNPSSKSLDFSNLNHSEKMPDSVAAILPCSSKSALETIGSSDCLFSPMDLKDENVTSIKGINFASLKNSVHSDILESKKAKTYKEDNVRRGNVKGELGCIAFSKMLNKLCSGNAEKSTRDEINELCRSISEKIKSCSIPSGSPAPQKSYLIDNDLARGFVVDICSEKEPFVESTEKQERQEDLNQMHNQDCTKLIAPEHYKHCFASTESLDVDDLGGESTSLKENLSTIQGPEYLILDGICTRSGRVLSSPTVFSLLSGTKVKTVSSYKMKVKRVLKKKNVATSSMDTPNYKSDISKEEKLASTYEDRGSMHKPPLDLANTSEICNFDSFKEKLNASRVKYSQNLSSLPSDDMINELKVKTGFAIGHVGMENSSQENCSTFMKCAVPLDNAAKVKEPDVSKAEGCNKNTRLQMSRRKKMSSQSTYVHQSPLTREKAKKLALGLPEILNLKRSRSGRLIVPQLDNGCQQIVYNADGTINGIKGVDMLCSREGIKSAPPKRRKIVTKS
ncbi:uncharacterized protein LOC121970935 [Zingiber officinale]|uniref:uncharacterized protein LOC121970935 n=1 Tax=Zingiber officinale TaxID=94328 RepID=UPI001C4D5F0E|nr:uncharacterized protein LOC121970935 [Zingiber officinale]